MFLWYMLPLMILGLVMVARGWKDSRAARLLAVWLLVYPVGDMLNSHPSSNAMKSLTGVCAFTLLAAWGLTSAAAWLWRRQRAAAVLTLAILLVAATGMTAFFLGDFYSDFNREWMIYHYYHADLIEALDWLKPQWNSVDAVLSTAGDIPHPYIYALVRLGYDPATWFREGFDKTAGPMPNGAHPGEDVYTRIGKMHFIHSDEPNRVLAELSLNKRTDRVILILRPGELHNVSATPVHVIRDPRGQPAIEIYELKI
jgi:hypothetical protein